MLIRLSQSREEETFARTFHGGDHAQKSCHRRHGARNLVARFVSAGIRRRRSDERSVEVQQRRSLCELVATAEPAAGANGRIQHHRIFFLLSAEHWTEALRFEERRSARTLRQAAREEPARSRCSLDRAWIGLGSGLGRQARCIMVPLGLRSRSTPPVRHLADWQCRRALAPSAKCRATSCRPRSWSLPGECADHREY